MQANFTCSIEEKTSIDGVDVYIKYDPKTHLHAIIAIHSLKRGPALGGCRFMHYSNSQDAIQDAIRLARGMTYKAAISELQYGGGKAVILKPDFPIDVENFWKSYAEFVNTLNGQYITTADSGIDLAVLDLLANFTPYITGQSRPEYLSTFPSPFTARGIIRGMEAAVHFKFKRNSLEGMHIAVQGVGSVGYQLVAELIAKGANLSITDTNPLLLQQCQDEFNVIVVKPEEIYSIECDIFSPNALGAILNSRTIPLLNTTIIAGSANNQLATPENGLLLAKKGILYAPDYIINAGGLLCVAGQYDLTPVGQITNQIDSIYDKLLRVFKISQIKQMPTHQVADIMAEDLLQQIHINT